LSTDKVLITVQDNENMAECKKLPDSLYYFKKYSKDDLLKRLKMPILTPIKFKAARFIPGVVEVVSPELNDEYPVNILENELFSVWRNRISNPSTELGVMV
jgi:hypothetical protein